MRTSMLTFMRRKPKLLCADHLLDLDEVLSTLAFLLAQAWSSHGACWLIAPNGACVYLAWHQFRNPHPTCITHPQRAYVRRANAADNEDALEVFVSLGGNQDKSGALDIAKLQSLIDTFKLGTSIPLGWSRLVESLEEGWVGCPFGVLHPLL